MTLFCLESEIMSKVLEKLKDNYIFAVIRGKSSDDAENISKYAVLGGIKNIEVTYTTPNASQAISNLKAYYISTKDVVYWCGNNYECRIGTRSN